jgi:glycine cleavage system regulatory protein
MKDLVLTLIGPDRPGLVETVADTVAAGGGNWLESRMAHLAGQFAGILRVEVPDDKADALVAAIRKLDDRGLRLVIEPTISPPTLELGRAIDLELVGQDRPGIMKEVSQLLASKGVNVEDLKTDRTSAPMSGEPLFSAKARVRVPHQLPIGELRTSLERLAQDLMVELRVAES